MNHFKRSIKTILLIIENIFYRTTMIVKVFFVISLKNTLAKKKNLIFEKIFLKNAI